MAALWTVGRSEIISAFRELLSSEGHLSAPGRSLLTARRNECRSDASLCFLEFEIKILFSKTASAFLHDQDPKGT
jgi:hypothetical protein